MYSASPLESRAYSFIAVDEETLVKLHFSNPSGLNLYARRSDV